MEARSPARRFARAVGWAGWVLSGAGVLATGLMGVLITADVVGRKFLEPIPGAVEFTELLMVATVFLPLAYVQRQRGHVAVVLFTQRLSPRAQAVLDALAYLVGLVIFGVMFWYTARLAWRSFLIREYTFGLINFPLWPSKMLVPLGLLAFCLQLLVDVVERTAFALGKKGGNR